MLLTLDAENDYKKVASEKKDTGFSLGSDSEGEPEFALDIGVLDEKVAAILGIGKFCMHAPKAC